MLKILDNLSLPALMVLALLLGLAPLEPQPHLLEKLQMLGQGVLVKPVDIFDLCMHASGLLLLTAKVARMIWLIRHQENNPES